MIDLNEIGQRTALARQIKADLDRYITLAYQTDFRDHLGASIIGHECSRYVWYVFRWCIEGCSDSRMLRLFNRGHREEGRFIEWLSGIGCGVSDRDAEGKQYRISGVEGHFGGSLDGRITLPTRYGIKQNVLLAEYKTNKKGADFDKLQKEGMILAKPRHYAQMCTYALKSQLEFGLYLNICKDNDELHVEVVKLDALYGKHLETRGQDIILATSAPRKIASSPAFVTCKFCEAASVCWHGAAPARNCRSCIYAHPAAEGRWYCNGWQHYILPETIRVGCPEYRQLQT